MLGAQFKNTKRVGLFAKLGRGRLDPQTVARLRMAEPRQERAMYLRFMRSLWELWTHRVLDTLDLATRKDGRPRERADAGVKLLTADWETLVDSSGLRGMLDKMSQSIAVRNQNYFDQVVRAPAPRVGARAEMIEDFRARNVKLIKGLGSDTVDDVNKVLSDATFKGLRHEELAEQVKERLGVGEARARLIARDQTLKFNASVHTAQAKAAGVTRYRWSTSHDGAVRDMHKKLDGTIQEYDNPPITNDEGDRNNPGEDYQCRCAAIPIIDLFEGIEDEPTPGPHNYTVPEPREAPAPVKPPRARPAPKAPAPPPTPVQSPAQGPAREPLLPPHVPQPLVTNAIHLSNALEDPESYGQFIRGGIRDQVSAASPGAMSKDINKSGAGAYEIVSQTRAAGVLASHMPDGTIVIGQEMHDTVQRGARLLADGGYHQPLADKITLSHGDAVVDPSISEHVKGLKGLNLLTHEEVHGYSRMTSESYRGEVGRVLEEVGTELSARQISFNLTPQLAEVEDLLDGRAIFEKGGTKVIANFRTYQEEIDGMKGIVAEELGVSHKEAGRSIVDAHRRGVMSDGPHFQSADDHLNAFTDALVEDPIKRAKVRARIAAKFGAKT